MSVAKSETATGEAVSSIKGFDKAFRCRDFQFEIGATYAHDGDVEACQSGFHACEYPLDVFSYYTPGESRYAEVTQAGKLSRNSDDSKVASARITIEAEISIPKIVERAIAWVLRQTKPTDSKHSEGDWSASSATGYQSASSATGYQSASSATGDRSASSVHGEQSCAMACGHDGRVLADKDGCALFLVYRDPDSENILHAWSGVTGRNGIKAGHWYSLDAYGQPVEMGR